MAATLDRVGQCLIYRNGFSWLPRLANTELGSGSVSFRAYARKYLPGSLLGDCLFKETLNNWGLGILQKMPAPARPKVGAFATVHLFDMSHVYRAIVNLAGVAQAPTRTGAGIFCNPNGYSEPP